jgi:hypothetical protein
MFLGGHLLIFRTRDAGTFLQKLEADENFVNLKPTFNKKDTLVWRVLRLIMRGGWRCGWSETLYLRTLVMTNSV